MEYAVEKRTEVCTRMLGKTHLSVGMAAAITLSAADTPALCALALAGGALGGVFADVDRLKNDKGRDALKGQLSSLMLMAAAALAGALLNWGFFDYIRAHSRSVLIGAAGLVLLWAVGVFQPHRGFTHSIAALVLFTLFAWLIYPAYTVAFCAGYASHLLLDVLNKKGLRLFWPLKGTLCLRLLRADGRANVLFTWLGFLVAAAVTAARLIG